MANVGVSFRLPDDGDVEPADLSDLVSEDRELNVQQVRSIISQLLLQLPWSRADGTIAADACIDAAALGYMSFGGWDVAAARAKAIARLDAELAVLDDKLIEFVEIALNDKDEVPADIMERYRAKKAEQQGGAS